MRKTLGFALGAGGSRGIAHVGFLKAMEEDGIRPDMIAGTSMGSIVGACYAKGMTPLEMEEIAKKLRAGDIFDLGILPLNTLGLMKWNKARRMIAGLLEDAQFEHLQIPFRCVAVDLRSAKLHLFSQGSVVDAVLASSSAPTLFRPVETEEGLFIDGSILCRVPVRQVREMGAQVVVAVDVLGGCEHIEKIPNMIALIARVYEIMDSALTATEHRRCRRFVDLWLEPELGDMQQFAFKNLDRALEAGYALGKKYAPKIRALVGE